MNTDQVRIERDIIYAEPGGTPLGLDLYRPAGEEPAPVIMLVHGGGWCQGERQGLDGFARELATDGYLAAPVSYRLAPAFPFPAACEDVSAALDWLVAHAAEYGGDPARIGGYGGFRGRAPGGLGGHDAGDAAHLWGGVGRPDGHAARADHL